MCSSRIEHLKSQNDLLTITLEECKGNAERMSMLVGKYESNATALRLALQYRYTHTHGWTHSHVRTYKARPNLMKHAKYILLTFPHSCLCSSARQKERNTPTR